MAAHRAQPEVSFEQQLALLEEGVAREALTKKRVYLDLKYWIFLRDAALGMPQKPVRAKLLEAMLWAAGADGHNPAI